MGLFNRKSADDVDKIITDTDKVDKAFERAAKREQRLQKFKMGKHHRIERQLVTLGVASGFLILGMGVSLAGNIEKNRNTLSNQAIYTKTAKFSKNADLQATTELVGTSKDGKTGYLLLKFADPTQISQNANNYKAFLSAYHQYLDSTPVGNVFVFGSTGYVGVTIHDEGGLANQLWDVTLRTFKDVSTSTSVNDEITQENGYAASFKKYNQLRIYANFGAKQATKLSLTSSSNPQDMYYEMVAKKQDKELRKEAVTQIAEIKRLLARMDEEEKAIVVAGYDAPVRPEVLRDVQVKDNTLQTSLVVPGGYNIAPNTTLKDGYLKQFIVGDVTDDTVSNLLAVKAEETDSLGTRSITKADGSIDFVPIATDKNKVKGVSTISADASSAVTNSFKVTELTKTGTTNKLYVTSVQSDVNSTTEMAVASTADELGQTYTNLYDAIRVLQTNVNAKRVALDEGLFAQKTLYSQASGQKHFEVWQQVAK